MFQDINKDPEFEKYKNKEDKELQTELAKKCPYQTLTDCTVAAVGNLTEQAKCMTAYEHCTIPISLGWGHKLTKEICKGTFANLKSEDMEICHAEGKQFYFAEGNGPYDANSDWKGPI